MEKDQILKYFNRRGYRVVNRGTTVAAYKAGECIMVASSMNALYSMLR